MTHGAPALYAKYFLDRQFERLSLFQCLAEQYNIQRALYAGSFVHVTPSFVFPEVVYVDSDKQANTFFNAPESYAYIAQRKTYPQEAQTRFYYQDYSKPFPEAPDSFDLLISQYAGFVGQDCKGYLKPGGYLLANNSHGDAGLAALDPDYTLVAVGFNSKDTWRINSNNLEAYFIPKKPVDLTPTYLRDLGRGIGYTKTANAYLFRKTS